MAGAASARPSPSAPTRAEREIRMIVWGVSVAESNLLCDGMVRARYRDGFASASPIVPGEIYRYTIDCWNTAQLFRQGHRIAVQITSSAFPKYDRNLNTGESLATGTRMAVAEQTIFHDAAHPSCVVLPIISR